MFNKKGSLDIQDGLFKISVFTLVFSFLSILFIFISLFTWATANDYLFYELQNLTEDLEQDNILKGGTAARTQGYGEDFSNFNLHLDELWLVAYLSFLINSFILAYRVERQNYYSFLGILFYGLMAFLFLLTIFSTITNWFNNQILTTIIPTAHILVPKFYFYLDNIGIFSALQLVICLIINMVDFDFAKINQKKRIEAAALKDEEVI